MKEAFTNVASSALVGLMFAAVIVLAGAPTWAGAMTFSLAYLITLRRSR